MSVIGMPGPVRPRRRLCALLVTTAVTAGTVAAGTIAAAASPAQAAAWIPYAYVLNETDATVSAYDAATGTVTATIPTGGGPESIAASPDGRSVYVLNVADESTSVISTATNTVTGSLFGSLGPGALGVSPDSRTVYIADEDGNDLEVISTATGTVTANVSVGQDPMSVAASPDGGTVYTSNWGDGSVSAVSTATGKVTATISAGTAPGTVAVSPDSRTVYVAEGSNGISVISAATDTVTATIPVSASNVAVSPDGRTVYAAATSGVSEISTATNKVTATIPVSAGSLALSPDGSTIYITNAGNNTVSAISTATSKVTATAAVGNGPVDVVAANVPAQPVVTSVSPANGLTAGGTSVTITGTGLAGATAVDFGTVPAAFTVNSGTQVTAVSPAQTAGPVDVTVTTQYGISAVSAADQFTYDQAPAFVMRTPPLTATAGRPYDYAFRASGLPAPSYALARGAPAWLAINSATGRLAGTPPAGTTVFTYTVTAANSFGAVTAGPFTVTVTVSADLSAVLSCPAAMTTGGAGSCTLTVANAGPASAAVLTAAIVLPAQLRQESCTPACTRLGNTITTWTRASLASGASAVFAVAVQATAQGSVTVLGAAGALSPDPRLGNNTSAAKAVINAASSGSRTG